MWTESIGKAWRRGSVGRVLALLAVAGLAACGEQAPETQTAANACRKVELVDRGSGRLVRGVEDLVADPATGVVFLAALDRWALEDAMESDAENLPQGGLYAVPASALAESDGQLEVANAVPGSGLMGGFFPQGLDLRRAGGEAALAVVNRAYGPGGLRQSDAWIAQPAIELFSYSGGALAHRDTLRHPRVCRPNDVAILADKRFAVSNDHGCDAVPDWLEDALGLPRATVVELNAEPGPEIGARILASGLGYANGVSLGADGRLYIAATREEAIRIRTLGAPGAGNTQSAGRLTLDMGPDNINPAPDGRLIVAGHPSLFSLALYRYRWFGRERAPTRIVAISPDGQREVLLDHPDGDILSAATAAALVDGLLIAGSVTDSGVMVCELAARGEAAD